MKRTLSILLAPFVLTLGLAALPSPSRAGEESAPAAPRPHQEDKAPPDPARVRAAIDGVKSAPAAERRKAAQSPIDLGPGALEETRKAREASSDPVVKAALDRAARWMVAAK